MEHDASVHAEAAPLKIRIPASKRKDAVNLPDATKRSKTVHDPPFVNPFDDDDDDYGLTLPTDFFDDLDSFFK